MPAGSVPAGFEAWNTDLHRFVTREWSPQAWAAGPGDAATATVTRWFLNGWNGSYSQLMSTTIPQYVQRPGESRVWYAYPGQNRSAPTLLTGWATTPAVVARALDDGTTQQTQASVNDLGQVTERIDALGRRTNYTYAANGIDLLEVRQTTGTANDLLASYGSYTARHLPQTVTDAAGQPMTQRSEFAFDGLGRRSRLQAIADGSPSPELRYVWCGFQICEGVLVTAVRVSDASDPVRKPTATPGSGLPTT